MIPQLSHCLEPDPPETVGSLYPSCYLGLTISCSHLLGDLLSAVSSATYEKWPVPLPCLRWNPACVLKGSGLCSPRDSQLADSFPSSLCAPGRRWHCSHHGTVSWQGTACTGWDWYQLVVLVSFLNEEEKIPFFLCKLTVCAVDYFHHTLCLYYLH